MRTFDNRRSHSFRFVSVSLSSLEDSSSNFRWAEIICGACGIQHVPSCKVCRKLETETNFWAHWILVVRRGISVAHPTNLNSLLSTCSFVPMLLSICVPHTHRDCCDYPNENGIKIDFISFLAGMSISSAQKLIIIAHVISICGRDRACNHEVLQFPLLATTIRYISMRSRLECADNHGKNATAIHRLRIWRTSSWTRTFWVKMGSKVFQCFINTVDFSDFCRDTFLPENEMSRFCRCRW